MSAPVMPLQHQPQPQAMMMPAQPQPMMPAQPQPMMPAQPHPQPLGELSVNTNKRPHEDDGEDELDDDDDGPLVDADEEYKWSCNQKELGVNSNSYRRFMAMNKPWQGIDNGTFESANHFFREREEQKKRDAEKKKKAKAATPKKATPKKTPTKKTPMKNADANADPESEGEDENEAPATPAPAAKKAKKQATLTDFGDIKLPGEDDHEVAIYDTCDEIRRKINAHLAKPEVTQAAFLKDIAAQCGVANIQGKQLTDFRSKSGPDSGNTSRVYYGSYVFFEKMRLKEGKPKSKHRLDMEKAWPKGMDTKTAHNRYIMFAGQYAVQDRLGPVTIHNKR